MKSASSGKDGNKRSLLAPFRLAGNKDDDAENKDKECVCDVCNETFVNANALRLHTISHVGFRIPGFVFPESESKEFKCGICNMKFTSNTALTLHKNFHSGSLVTLNY